MRSHPYAIEGFFLIMKKQIKSPSKENSMKYIKKILIIFLIIFLGIGIYYVFNISFSYSLTVEETIVWQDAGTLVSIIVVPIPFGENAKSQIQTTTGFYVIYGICSGKIGKKVYIRKTENQNFLLVEDDTHTHTIIGL
jgi:hypothetical protein